MLALRRSAPHIQRLHGVAARVAVLPCTLVHWLLQARPRRVDAWETDGIAWCAANLSACSAESGARFGPFEVRGWR